METRYVTDIQVGDRFRQDMGDIDALVGSISVVGLLHPIVITSNNELVAGARRLAAVKQLGWIEVPVRVIDMPSLIAGEYAENVSRKDFTPSEMVAICDAVESFQGQRDVGVISEGYRQQRAAKMVGSSHGTLSKARQVVDAAKRDPEKFQFVLHDMDATGNVSKAYGTLKAIQKRDARADAGADAPMDTKIVTGDFMEMGALLPDDSIDVIFTDPPYPKEYIHTYGNLAEFAARVLKPGGLCIAYAGQLYLPQYLDLMTKHLEYVWMLGMRHIGATAIVHKVGLMAGWKPIILCAKPPFEIYWPRFPDFSNAGEREKDLHDWQQDEGNAKYFMERFCPPGATICDPFVGAGTFLSVAKRLGFNYIGYEIDPKTADIARNRLAETPRGDWV